MCRVRLHTYTWSGLPSDNGVPFDMASAVSTSPRATRGPIIAARRPLGDSLSFVGSESITTATSCRFGSDDAAPFPAETVAATRRAWEAEEQMEH